MEQWIKPHSVNTDRDVSGAPVVYHDRRCPGAARYLSRKGKSDSRGAVEEGYSSSAVKMDTWYTDRLLFCSLYGTL